MNFFKFSEKSNHYLTSSEYIRNKANETKVPFSLALSLGALSGAGLGFGFKKLMKGTSKLTVPISAAIGATTGLVMKDIDDNLIDNSKDIMAIEDKAKQEIAMENAIKNLDAQTATAKQKAQQIFTKISAMGLGAKLLLGGSIGVPLIPKTNTVFKDNVAMKNKVTVNNPTVF